MSTSDNKMPPENTPSVSGSNVDNNQNQAVKVCPGCHTSNRPTSQFCYRCGLKLSEKATLPGAFIALAGFWPRFVAFIIDNIVVIIGSIIVTLILAQILSTFFPDLAANYSVDEYSWEAVIEASERPLTWVDWVITFSYIVVGIAYWTISIGWKGQTLGKLIVGLRVVKVDGGRVGFLRAFGRVWGYIIDIFTIGIGFLVIAFNEQKRGLHDFMFNTKVIKV